MVVLWLRQRTAPGVDPPRTHPIPMWLRVLVGLQAVLLLVVGTRLYLAPAHVVVVVAVAVDPAHRRAPSAPGRSASAWRRAHALWEHDARRVRPAAMAYVVFAVLETISVLRYTDVGDWSSIAGVIYLVFIASSAVTGLITLWLARAEPSDAPGGRCHRALIRSPCSPSLCPSIPRPSIIAASEELVMSERTSYKPGTPSWVDIGVPDTAKAAEFYGTLLGWEADIDPRPEAGGYGMFTLRGLERRRARPATEPRHAAVLVGLRHRVRRRRDAGAGHGGRRHHDRRPDGRLRRRAHGRDPGLRRVLRVDVAAEPAHRRAARERAGTFGWNELATNDLAAATAFYTDVFGWGVTDADSAMLLAIFTVDDDMVCGAHTMGEGEFPAWSIWFTVDDVDASAAQVEVSSAARSSSSRTTWTSVAAPWWPIPSALCSGSPA